MKKSEFLELIRGEKENKYFAVSEELREKYFSRTFLLRGLIEFSNYCNKNCL